MLEMIMSFAFNVSADCSISFGTIIVKFTVIDQLQQQRFKVLYTVKLKQIVIFDFQIFGIFLNEKISKYSFNTLLSQNLYI